jgi:hypothetical protein
MVPPCLIILYYFDFYLFLQMTLLTSMTFTVRMRSEDMICQNYIISLFTLVLQRTGLPVVPFRF